MLLRAKILFDLSSLCLDGLITYIHKTTVCTEVVKSCTGVEDKMLCNEGCTDTYCQIRGRCKDQKCIRIPGAGSQSGKLILVCIDLLHNFIYVYIKKRERSKERNKER